MSRNPCRPGSSRATAVATGRSKPNIKNVQSTIPKKGPPPRAPTPFCASKPKTTKAMQERIKAAEKMKAEFERKERERKEAMECRRPQRAAAPVGGDARMGREGRPRAAGAAARPTARAPAAGAPRSRPTSAKQTGTGPAACSTAGPPAAARRAAAAAAACKPGPPARKAAAPPATKRAASAPCPKKPAAPARKSAPAPEPPAAVCTPAPPVPERTRNLAESMNADIVQAEPLQPGMVDNIIIPPGAINTEKTTIVSIPQPEGSPTQQVEQHSTIAAGSLGTSQAANKSMQVISEALDEQDANESEIINSKLQDLQSARRDFVLAVANVGNNSINLGDEDFGNIMDISPPELMVTGSDPGSPMGPRLLDFSDIEEPCIPDYSSRHPVVESAREYMRSRQTYEPPDDCMDLLDPEYLEGCGLVGTEELADQLPVCGPTDNYTVIPRRREMYQYPSGQMEQLERFFDLENYPPCPLSPPPRPTGPPPGREHIHPDLWELDDPWCREPDGPDLIDWDYNC